MQTVQVIGLLLAIFVGVKAGTTEGFKKQVRPIVNECKATHAATDDDAESALNLDVNYSENGKCMVKCVLEKLSFMKNDQFIPYEQNEKTYQSLFAGDPKKLANAQQIVTSCQADAKKNLPGDPCEAATASIICLSTSK